MVGKDPRLTQVDYWDGGLGKRRGGVLIGEIGSKVVGRVVRKEYGERPSSRCGREKIDRGEAVSG